LCIGSLFLFDLFLIDVLGHKNWEDQLKKLKIESRFLDRIK